MLLGVMTKFLLTFFKTIQGAPPYRRPTQPQLPATPTLVAHLTNQILIYFNVYKHFAIGLLFVHVPVGKQ